MARRFLPRRSARQWALRRAVAAAVAVAGCFTVAHSLAQVLAEDDPALAHRLAPWDGRITAALAASLTGAERGDAERRRSDDLARRALRQDATAVLAASTLGINAQLRGDTAAARKMFSYAERLSRRDLQTQLWMIEDAVGRGDITGALRHYDIALRTKKQSWDLLFPILENASAGPEVRAALVKTLAGKPLWAQPFIDHVAAKPSDPKASSALLLDLSRAGVSASDGAHARIIDALIGGGFAAEAWRHYAAIRPGADPRKSRDPGFTATSEPPAAFDWVPAVRSGVTTSIERNGGRGMFDFFVQASAGGPLLMQAQALPPGTYRLDGHSTGIEQPARSLPFWTLVCRADRRELGRITVPNSGEASGSFSGRFAVPANCPVQDLVLVARASDAVSGQSGQIDRVQLAPAP
jgi:hypothetical protein